ncbi:MAG: Smr/MutS family protein [Ruminiclostridium sp.]|nr:Smr/MutS family protein [Ruminiclostridium sp.]
MEKYIKCVNIENGMPAVTVAEKRILFEISTAKRERVKVLKIIHGYGSTGVGGKLKAAAARLLEQKQREGIIKSFVGGNEWDIFNQSARSILDSCDEARKDPDLGNYNAGITMVLL